MKANKSSWHYKLVSSLLNNYPSNDLCVYFWQVVGALLLSIIMLLVAAMLISIPIGAAASIAIVALSIPVPDGMARLLGSCLGMTLFFLILCIGHKAINYAKGAAKKDSFIKEYIKGKAGKYCQRIEWK